MVFFAGALAGCVVGLGVGIALQRRFGASTLMAGRTFATVVAMAALLVAAVALARSDGHHSPAAAAPVPASPDSTVTSTTAGATSTSGVTQPTGLVAVPNVEHLARAQALTILQNAGLKVTIESLALSNVPAGFVISQSPLPDAMTSAGATVALVVSAAA